MPNRFVDDRDIQNNFRRTISVPPEPRPNRTLLSPKWLTGSRILHESASPNRVKRPYHPDDIIIPKKTSQTNLDKNVSSPAWYKQWTKAYELAAKQRELYLLFKEKGEKPLEKAIPFTDETMGNWPDINGNTEQNLDAETVWPSSEFYSMLSSAIHSPTAKTFRNIIGAFTEMGVDIAKDIYDSRSVVMDSAKNSLNRVVQESSDIFVHNFIANKDAPISTMISNEDHSSEDDEVSLTVDDMFAENFENELQEVKFPNVKPLIIQVKKGKHKFHKNSSLYHRGFDGTLNSSGDDETTESDSDLDSISDYDEEDDLEIEDMVDNRLVFV